MEKETAVNWLTPRYSAANRFIITILPKLSTVMEAYTEDSAIGATPSDTASSFSK